jgi:hypothetical protein
MLWFAAEMPVALSGLDIASARVIDHLDLGMKPRQNSVLLCRW